MKADLGFSPTSTGHTSVLALLLETGAADDRRHVPIRMLEASAANGDGRGLPAWAPDPYHRALMLVGRSRERARVDALLNQARGGSGGALLVSGEPGVGKSALCGYATERAEGMTVLKSGGVESESSLPYASLYTLLKPLLTKIETLPEAQREALEVALGLTSGPPGQPFAVYAGTLGLLAAAAEDAPVLMIVDDLQWVDQSTAAALLFVARRVEAEAIAIMMTLRDERSDTIDASGIDPLRLAGLDRAAGLELLEHLSSPHRLDRSVARRIQAGTEGNPLALYQLVRSLTPEQLAGKAPLEDPLPVGERLQELYLRHLGSLDEQTRLALLVAAAAGTVPLDVVERACAYLGGETSGLDAAETAGLVTLTDGEIEFTHALVRAAVFHAATQERRRAVHEALAHVLERDPDRRARHLAAASVRPDEAVAALVEAAGHRSLARSGVAEAATLLEQAARITPRGVHRARRFLRAAETFQMAGRFDRARSLLEAATDGAERDTLQQAELLRGIVDLWGGRPEEALDALVAAAGEAEAHSPSHGAKLLTLAATARIMDGAIRPGLELLERAYRLAQDDETKITSGTALALGLLLGGELDRAVQLLPRTLEYLDRSFERQGLQDPSTQGLVHLVSEFLIASEDYETGRVLGSRVIHYGRRYSAPAVMPFPLATLSDIEFRTGAWGPAMAHATESVRLCFETGLHTQLAHSLVVLARLEAARGMGSCRTHATEAVALAERFHTRSIVTYAEAARGLLELGSGDAEKAAAHLDTVAESARHNGLEEPGLIQWGADHVEALIRARRPEQAATALERFEAQAARAGRIWARAAAARCRGLLAPDDGFEQPFADALALHDQTPTPFERARTLFCLGERRRRAGRRIDAREALQAALETFSSLGAAPWAERARSELRASGQRLTTRRSAQAMDLLTPQELQLALLVSEGATNKEAAASLFLSPKTVENHLSRIFTKLDIRSRVELARLVPSPDPPEDLAG